MEMKEMEKKIVPDYSMIEVIEEVQASMTM